MVKNDFLTPEKLRNDGRKPHEIRPMTCEIGGIVEGSDGSASVSMGLTKAVAYVYGPRPLSKRGQSVTTKAAVIVDFRTAVFGGIDRRRKSRGDRQSTEKSSWLQKTFQEVILTEQFPRSQIEICVEVMVNDGSALSVALNAITLALVDAGVPMKDLVVSCTLGLADSHSLLVDVTQSESETGNAQICMATYSRTNRIALCEVESKIPVAAFEEGLKIGISSCSEIARTLRGYIAQHAESRIESENHSLE